MKNLKAVKRIIGSVWTVEYKLVDKDKVEIIKYTREDEEGYRREDQLPTGFMTETEERIVVNLVVAGTAYTIVNPKHIFDYK